MALPQSTPFEPDTDADADAVNARFENIENRFTAGIMNEDISPSARILGTKLSERSGEQVPETRLGNNAVSARVLQSDLASNVNRAVGTDHIQDAAVTKAKLAAGASNLVVVTGSFSINTISQSGFGNTAFVPATAYPKASWDVVACFAKDVSNTGAAQLWSLSVLARDTGTDWDFPIYGLLQSGYGSLVISGTAVVVFQAK
jgi:hypothetical protein